MAAAFLLDGIAADLPDVALMEDVWGPLGQERFTPVSILDRTGSSVLHTFYVELDEEAEWVRVNPEAERALPQHLRDAILAAIDPAFPESTPRLFSALMASLRWPSEEESLPGVTERLAEAVLLPLSLERDTRSSTHLVRALLAADLAATYSSNDLFEWYINSADFGNYAYGIDAASLYNFGVHAWDLDLAESAALAAALREDHEVSVEGQAIVLEEMLMRGLITEEQAEDASWDALPARTDVRAEDIPDFAVIIEEQLHASFGAPILGRPGLRVLSTIDLDLNLQLECAAATHLERLNGGDPAVVVPAGDGGACLAASLLTPLPPGDAGQNYQVDDVQLIVLDNATGQIQAAVGDVRIPHPGGAVVYPFIYLTAFSQGYAPGSMVLDILPDSSDGGVPSGEGPVLMRTAIQEGLQGAAQTMVDQLGLDAVIRTTATLGLEVFTRPIDETLGQEPGQRHISVLETAMGFSVIANQGILRSSSVEDGSAAAPVLIVALEDALGTVTYQVESDSQAVLSRSLAYLLLDILRSDPARGDLYSSPGPLELDRPGGILTAESQDGTEAWMVGFTPDLTVVVWMNTGIDRGMLDIGIANSTASLWRAALRYAAGDDVAVTDWSIPAGVTEVEICSPSGLLPTQYCPEVVTEVFLEGTEPTQADNLYQPFLLNRETGKLATIYTPEELIEERVYLIPPAGAEAWARSAGIEHPPQEYDVVLNENEGLRDVMISSPELFNMVRGEVSIRGRVVLEELDFYRLQIGEGLNPSRWFLIGSDQDAAVYNGQLGVVDTSEWNGLYTIELVAVRRDGVIVSDAVSVTVDNLPPEITVLAPASAAGVSLEAEEELLIQVEVEDDVGVEEVIYYVDNRRVMSFSESPYTFSYRSVDPGFHAITARAVDLAGNFTTIDVLRVEVVP